jgi:hypothetical protein
MDRSPGLGRGLTQPIFSFAAAACMPQVQTPLPQGKLSEMSEFAIAWRAPCGGLLLLTAGHVGELGQVLEEGEADLGGGAVAVLGDDDLGGALLR